MDHKGVALSDEAEHGIQLWALGILAQGFVGEQFVHLGLFQLALWVLVVAADPDITDMLSLQGASSG